MMMNKYTTDAIATFIVNTDTYISTVETRKPPLSHICKELKEFIASTESLNTDEVENELGDLIFTAIKLAKSRGHNVSLIRTILLNKSKCDMPFEKRSDVNYIDVAANAARVIHQAFTIYNEL